MLLLLLLLLLVLLGVLEPLLTPTVRKGSGDVWVGLVERTTLEEFDLPNCDCSFGEKSAPPPPLPERGKPEETPATEAGEESSSVDFFGIRYAVLNSQS